METKLTKKENLPGVSATELKATLWDTLQKLRAGEIQPANADAVARQAREIMRTVHAQLEISRQSCMPIQKGLVEFAAEDVRED